MFKAFFFDLDNTVIDSSLAGREASIKAYKDFGFDYVELRKLTTTKHMHGLTMHDFLETVNRDAGVNIPLAELLAAREKYFLVNVREYTELLPGAFSAMNSCKDAGGIVALVSSGTDKYINIVLEKFKLKDVIDFYISADDVTKGKPDPTCYLMAYKRLKEKAITPKDKILVVEDAVIGIMAAQAAGLKTLMVPSDTKENIDVKPDYMLRSLTEFNIQNF